MPNYFFGLDWQLSQFWMALCEPCVGGEAPAAVAAAARGRGASLPRFKWLNGVFHLCFDDRPGQGIRVTGFGGPGGGPGPGGRRRGHTSLPGPSWRGPLPVSRPAFV